MTILGGSNFRLAVGDLLELQYVTVLNVAGEQIQKKELVAKLKIEEIQGSKVSKCKVQRL